MSSHSVDVSIYQSQASELMFIDFTPQSKPHITYTLQKEIDYEEFEYVLCGELHYVTTTSYKTPHARELWKRLIKRNWKAY